MSIVIIAVSRFLQMREGRRSIGTFSILTRAERRKRTTGGRREVKLQTTPYMTYGVFIPNPNDSHAIPTFCIGFT
jgi:hypothetical protein